MRTSTLLLPLAVCAGFPAMAQEQSREEQLALLAGARLFDQVCRPSVGSPSEFLRLVSATALKRLEPETTAAHVGKWGVTVSEVVIVVDYTVQLGCFVYMSHANSKDMGRNLGRIVNALIAQGVPVGSPPSDSVEASDPAVVRFDVHAPQGKYALMTMYDPSRASWRKAAYVVQPFK